MLVGRSPAARSTAMRPLETHGGKHTEGKAAQAGSETEKKVVVLREKTLTGTPRDEAPEKSSTGMRDYITAEPSYTESTGYTPVNGLLVALLKPRSYEAEQFKILRTNLLFPETGQPAKSMLITSAAPGDGKSFVSSNLAVSLALDHDRKVLLVDADVRRSAIHKIFGLNGSEKGICDFLADRVPLSSLLVKTSLNNLFILPAGRLTHAPDQCSPWKDCPGFSMNWPRASVIFLLSSIPPRRNWPPKPVSWQGWSTRSSSS